MKRAAIALALLVPVQASAYKIDKRVVPQPKVNYHVALPDWRKPMDRAVRALNRARVGIKLVKTGIPENASVQVGRLDQSCGIPGVSATTLLLVGGYAAIYLPSNCNATAATIIAAHELGHALGLKHDNSGCNLMNSSGTGANAVPTGCLGQSIPWKRSPWRPDDLAGLRRLYRNTPPKLALKLTGPRTVQVGDAVRFRIAARDKERNLSETRIDYGDGTSDEVLLDDKPPSVHAYAREGTYTIKVTALDFYLKKVTKSVRVTITPPVVS